MAIIDDTIMDESGQPVVVRIEVAENSIENYSYDRQTRGGFHDCILWWEHHEE